MISCAYFKMRNKVHFTSVVWGAVPGVYFYYHSYDNVRMYNIGDWISIPVAVDIGRGGVLTTVC